MKKTGLIISLMVAVTGCSNSYKDANFTARPPELSDCKIFTLTNSAGEHITIARCPHATTSTTFKSGKSTQSSVVDSVEAQAWLCTDPIQPSTCVRQQSKP